MPSPMRTSEDWYDETGILFTFRDGCLRLDGLHIPAETCTQLDSCVFVAPDPLSHNMFRMQPQKHFGTLIWLHGIADPINRYKNLFEMWQNGVHNVRFGLLPAFCRCA